MALHLKTFGTRTVTALVFVIVFLSCVILNYYLFSAFFFLVALLGLNEFYSLTRHLGAAPVKWLGVVLASINYLAFINWNFMDAGYTLSTEMALLIVVLNTFLFFAAGLFTKSEQSVKDSLYGSIGIFYAVLPMCLLHKFVFVAYPNQNELMYYPNTLLGIIFLIWSNDTFAYLGGSLFGKHKLIERISPGKTIEGTLFGIAVSFAVSFLIRTYLAPGSGNLWPVLGILVPVLATIGDLVESMLKRQAGVKDSGTLMPGHGGILDRFDSLIFVSPFVLLILSLLELY